MYTNQEKVVFLRKVDWHKTCVFALLLLIVGSVHAQSNRQPITLQLNNVTIRDFFKEIESKTQFSIVYRDSLINNKKDVSVRVTNRPLDEVMRLVLTPRGLQANFSNKTIIITETVKKNGVNQPGKSRTVTGQVTDAENGEPLPGVNIIIEGSSKGVITGENGVFSIGVGSNDVLVFSLIGMESQKIAVADKNYVDVVMREQSEMLDEVQIVGFGQQKKGSVTSSVASVKGESLRVPVGKLSNSFAGQVAGLISIQRSGEPGYDAAEFWIRGISSFAGGTSPLVLVDGVPRSLNDIEAEEIESFTVLKDAAATAIYGAEGANGVVLITSKRGRAQKAKISYRGEASYLTPTRRPRYANSYDYLSLYNEALVNEGKDPVFSQDVLEKYRTGEDPDLYPSVDWWDVLINDHTYNTRHTLNFRGGTENARYFVSGAYFEESGYFKSNPEYNNNTGVKRYNLRSNIDIDVTKTTLLRVDFSGQYLTQNRSYGGTQEVFDRISRIPPYLFPAVYSDGTFAQHPSFSNNRQNPWLLLTETGYAKTYRTFIQSKIDLEQKLDFITEGLKIRGVISYDSDANFFTSRSKTPATFYATGRDADGKLIFQQIQNEVKFGEPSESNNGEKKIYLEAAIDYKRDFDLHSVTGMLLTYRKNRQLHNEALSYRKEAYLGRVTYTYDNRYTVEMNFGITGSEQFAKENRYGFFPALGLAWNLYNEPYFPVSWQKTVSNLRFRGSIGKTGNDATGGARFLHFPTFTDTSSYGWGIGSSGVTNSLTGLTEGRFESPGLGWEIETKRNIGVDFALWNGRVDITADYFNDDRTNILLQRRTVTDMAGFRQSPWQNYGIVNNEGFDASINLKHNVGDVRLSGKGTFTFARNTIVEYDELPQLYPWLEVTGKRITQQGTGQNPLIAERLFAEDDFDITYDNENNKIYTLKPGIVGSPWLPQTLPGDIKYKDLNGDGILDNNDRVYDPDGWHPAVPEIVYGFGFGADYKGFYINTFFQGAANVTVNLNNYSASFMPFHWGLIESNVRQEIVESRWTQENPDPNAFFPRLRQANMGNSNTHSTFWYRSGNFLRLKNLEIGYNLNRKTLKYLGISASRIYLSGYNLHVWDQVKMFDPELGNTAGGTRYPLSRTWTIGLEFTI